MKKYILLFVLLISCCFANAKTTLSVLGSAGTGWIANDDVNYGVSVEASMDIGNSNWAFLPSVNFMMVEDSYGAFYGELLAGYRIPIGYVNTIIPKIGIAAGSENYGSILGPAVGLNFEKKHFVMQINAFYSGTISSYEEYYYDEYSPYALTLSFGYKF